MAQYEFKNIALSLSGKEILKHSDFRMNDKEKIGVVGRNGAGKTTLLRFIVGEIEKDYNDDGTLGEIVKSSDCNIGYLTQIVKDNEKTAFEFLKDAYKNILDVKEKIDILTTELDKEYDEKKATKLNEYIDYYTRENGHYFEKELKSGFVKFGFSIEELDKKISEFSGGQVTKISLLKLLLSKPDVLLLDEPTNHLDVEAIEWMEEYLSNYKKNIIIVSHDRMFLDNVCNVIVDVENYHLTRYEGNYTYFANQKKINYELELAIYNKNQKEIERLTALTDRFRYKATKASMVQSKDKIIEKLKENTIRPEEADTKNFKYHIIPLKEGGKDVLRCEKLSFGYNNNPIGSATFMTYKGDRIGIIGKNGTGKSTLLKTIVKMLPKINGECIFGHDIEYQYFDQKIAENMSEKTLFEDFSDAYPYLTNTDVRNRLGRFLFTGDDVEKIVKNLSGGEKVRLCFAKLFEKRPNLLILDEPTNHLDILGKESLEDIIKDYEGTVIFVSHDRYFTKKIANKILYFEEDKTTFFEFGYEDYERYVKGIKETEEELLNRKKEEKKEIDKTPKGVKEGQKVLKSYKEAKSANDYNRDIRNGIIDESFDSDVSNVAGQNEENKLTGQEAYLLNKQKSKNEKLIKKIEEKIDKLEKDKEELKKEYSKDEYQTDFNKLCEIDLSIQSIQKEIETLMSQWEELQRDNKNSSIC